LGALERQALDDPLEIVVVDDASADAVSVAAAIRDCPRARLIRLDEDRGPAAARNVAVRAAKGRFLLFTDDDCEPDEHWAAQLVAALADGADAVAGRTIDAGGGRLAAASQVIADHVAERARDPGRQTQFAASNNFAATADVMNAVPFDEWYPDAAAEDRDWCMRLTSAGRVLVVDPGALVVHHQHLGTLAFWRQHQRYGRGSHRFRRKHPAVAAFRGPSFYSELVVRGFARGGAIGALVLLAQVATLVGYVREAASSWRRRE
jgi:glycosyltransferase involved in cell wall biosynthesis